MNFKYFWPLIVISALLTSCLSAWADDTDGVVDVKEKGDRYIAVTEPLVVYDKNGNGYLEPEESNKYLRDKYKMIQEYGNTGVDSDLLQQYDADGNGSIDVREAEDIRDDIMED